MFNMQAARDSVWVIESELDKLAQNTPWSSQIRDNIQRNVDHLKLVVADADTAASGENIDDLHGAIAAGEQALANHI